MVTVLFMDSLIATFHIDWKLILAQAINFAVVIAVLYYFALKPLKTLMDERGKTIQGGLDNAQKQQSLLAEQEALYQQTLADARSEAVSIMNTVTKEAETKRSELIAGAQSEATAIVAAGKKELEQEKQKMILEAKKEIATLVFAVTEKVVGTVAKERVEPLIEEGVSAIAQKST